MARIATFHELIVWQRAMDLAERLYREVRHFPSDERFGLVRQLQRASASVPANIAEGFNRRSRAAYRFHVAIGLGSQAELRTHLELAKRLSFITVEPLRGASRADKRGRPSPARVVASAFAGHRLLFLGPLRPLLGPWAWGLGPVTWIFFLP